MRASVRAFRRSASTSPGWLQESFEVARPRRAPREQSLTQAPLLASAPVSLGPVESPEGSRTLRVCLVGPTNAGKSTLLNQLSNSPVSIVSDKIHTTRENTLGYLTDPQAGAQIEFIDAPGSLGPNVPLLRRAIWEAVRAADIAFIVVDAAELAKPGPNRPRLHGQLRGFFGQLAEELAAQEAESEAGAPGGAKARGAEAGAAAGAAMRGAESMGAGEAKEEYEEEYTEDAYAEEEEEDLDEEAAAMAKAWAKALGGEVDDAAAGAGGPAYSPCMGILGARPRPLGARTLTVLVLNKVDRVNPKERLLSVSRKLCYDFGHTFDWPCFMVSAKTGDGVRDLRRWMLTMSRPGQWIVPQGTTHVQPPLTRATELIREQIFRCFRDELPYTIAQRNIGWTELPGGGLRIDQQLLLPPKNAGGPPRASQLAIVQKRLPQVGKAARDELIIAFKRPVSLFLHLGTMGPNDDVGLPM